MPRTDPGDPTGPGDHSVPREADADLDAGAVVAINQSNGNMDEADGDEGDLDQFAGVVRDDVDSGDNGGLVTEAPAGIVAAVAADISAGERLDVGNATDGTVGELDTSDGGPVLALTDEGEGDLDDGYARVAY